MGGGWVGGCGPFRQFRFDVFTVARWVKHIRQNTRFGQLSPDVRSRRNTKCLSEISLNIWWHKIVSSSQRTLWSVSMFNVSIFKSVGESDWEQCVFHRATNWKITQEKTLKCFCSVSGFYRRFYQRKDINLHVFAPRWTEPSHWAIPECQKKIRHLFRSKAFTKKLQESFLIWFWFLILI